MNRCLLLIVAFYAISAAIAKPFVPDTPFQQEYHEPYPVGGEGNDVRASLVDHNDHVFIATKAGVRVFENGEWKTIDGMTDGPTYDLYVDDQNIVWVGAWDGIYRIENREAKKVRDVNTPISVIGGYCDVIIALGPDSFWQYEDSSWQRVDYGFSKNVQDIAVITKTDDCSQPDIWVATKMGLYRHNISGLRHYYTMDELISGELYAVTVAPDGRVWLGSWGGIDVYENGVRVQSFDWNSGLPNYDIRSLTFASDGTLWAGTALGVSRFDGENWSLRHSHRWLLSDDVRDIAFDSDGTAWIATAKGVSAIKTKMMTLAEKSDFYLERLYERHVREPWLVEKCYYPDPSVRSKWIPNDDDNDGQYTNMYLAMECMRYAATKDPQAKEAADKAFNAMEFLQTVTGTDGFIARTVIPATWTRMADANEEVSPQEAAERRVRDARYKIVEERWRPTPDGKWLWKGDTSSDEVTGHFFGYYIYYTFVADDAQKERVQKLAARVMDYIIEGGYTFRDTDGTHTRWGVWAPERLIGDPDWRVERPINAFEILSFLKVTYAITGDEKYQREYENLIEEHGYAEFCRRPKSYGVSERTHIDDDLLGLSIPGLILNETDAKLREIYMEGITWAYETVRDDMNPYVNFFYGMAGGTDFELEESVFYLRDHPLDLIQWTVDSSKREDIEWKREPMLEPLQTGRMLPPSERGVMRWDKNPWSVQSGDFHDPTGRLESAGVHWLLPYWMGRYYGWIGAPE